MKVNALQLIASERNHQMFHGFDAIHDDRHTEGELARGAMAYISGTPHPHWPFESGWWKPTGDRIRDLTKAAAMIAAEIERLLRRRLYIIEFPPGQDNGDVAENVLALVDKVGPVPVRAMLASMEPLGQWRLKESL